MRSRNPHRADTAFCSSAHLPQTLTFCCGNYTIQHRKNETEQAHVPDIVDFLIPHSYSTAVMLTDAPPRTAKRIKFLESNRLTALDLPQDGNLVEIARSLEMAMVDGKTALARKHCDALLAELSEFYRVPDCGFRVLAARPLRVRERWTSELFGDYSPDTMLVRVWMRTAVRKEVTSFGTFLSTLCHEFCHHLDFAKFRFPDSWHTRGFYERAGALYHGSRGTPPKHLFWTPVSGERWRIN